MTKQTKISLTYILFFLVLGGCCLTYISPSWFAEMNKNNMRIDSSFLILATGTWVLAINEAISLGFSWIAKKAGKKDNNDRKQMG